MKSCQIKEFNCRYAQLIKYVFATEGFFMKKLLMCITVFLSLSLYALKGMVGEGLAGDVDKVICKKFSQNPDLARRLRIDFSEAFNEYKASFEILRFRIEDRIIEEYKPSFYEYQRFMYSIIKQILQLGYGIEDLWGVKGQLLLFEYLKLVMLEVPVNDIKILHDKICIGLQSFLIWISKTETTVKIFKDRFCIFFKDGKMAFLEQ